MDIANVVRLERVRKATNQRHPGSKKRIKSHREDAKLEHIANDVNQKSASRENNRLAAARCRREKRENVAKLEVKYNAAVSAYQFLKREVRKLRDQLTLWRTLALEHMYGHPGCNCEYIIRYNKNQAHITALSVQPLYAYALSLTPWLSRLPEEIVS